MNLEIVILAAGQGQDFDFTAEAHRRNDPTGHRRADVGTVNDPHGLIQCQQARVHETDGGHGDSVR